MKGIEMKGPMNGPHIEKKPELKVEARFDSISDDSKYRAERKADIEQKMKLLKSTMKGMTPDKAHKMVMASMEKEMKRCEIEAMEYEDAESVSDAFDEDDQADGKKK